MFGLGTQELIIIAVIVAFLFGIKRLPNIGRDLGTGIKEFQKAIRSIGHQDEEEK